MTNIHIPPEAVEAAARELTMALVLAVDEDCRACALTDDERIKVATAAILAALENWPGMNHDSQAWRGYGGEVLILPLNTENPDAET